MSTIYSIELCRKYYIMEFLRLLRANPAFIFFSDLIGKQGNRLVRIRIPTFFWPQFIWARDELEKRIGKGKGKPGDEVGEEGEDLGGPGQGHGEHERDYVFFDLTAEELIKLLFAAIKLPRLTPRNRGSILTPAPVLHGIKKIPGRPYHFKTLFRDALKHNLQMDPDLLKLLDKDKNDHDFIITIIPGRDKGKRVVKEIVKESSEALIIYLRDVSGSISDKRKEIEDWESRLIEEAVKRDYKKVKVLRLFHDTNAWIVGKDDIGWEEYYTTGSGGGTAISSGLSLVDTILTPGHPDTRKNFRGQTCEYNPQDIDVILVYFGDGDNWGEDNPLCGKILTEGVSNYGKSETQIGPLLPKLAWLWYAQTAYNNNNSAYYALFKPLEGKHPYKVRAFLIQELRYAIDALIHFCKDGGEIDVWQ